MVKCLRTAEPVNGFGLTPLICGAGITNKKSLAPQAIRSVVGFGALSLSYVRAREVLTVTKLEAI